MLSIIFNHRNALIRVFLLTLCILLVNSVGIVAAEATDFVPVPQEKAQKHVVINIPSRSLTVYNGDLAVRRFPVGVGRPGFMTPVGKHQVIRKIVNPGWENPYKARGASRIKPGRNNPLGTRWIGFKANNRGEYGIHGTNRPQSVGKFSSHGCVRMQVKDAEALFEMVEMGTPVEVTYDVVEFDKKGDQVFMRVYADKFRKGKPTFDAVKAQLIQRFPQVQVKEQTIKNALSLPNEKAYVVAEVVPLMMPGELEPLVDANVHPVSDTSN